MIRDNGSRSKSRDNLLARGEARQSGDAQSAAIAQTPCSDRNRQVDAEIGSIMLLEAITRYRIQHEGWTK